MSATTPPGVETRGPAIVIACIVAPLVSACFVSLRVYARRFVTRSFGIDDWCSLATLLISIPYSVCLSITTYHGMGMHEKDMEKTPGLEMAYYKWLLISSEFYALGLLGYKTAILLLYIRIFGIEKKFRYACYAVMTFNTCYLLSNIILQIFSCTPVEKYFDKSIKDGRCVSLIPPDIAWGAMSMLSDLLIAILPIPMVWRLKLPRRSKYLLSIVFLSGLIAFTVAAVRWIYGIIDLTVAEDRTWVAGITFFVSVLEIHTGIICGCTPTFRPLVRFVRERSHEYRSRRKSSFSKDGKSSARPSLERVRHSLEKSRPSLEKARPSFEKVFGAIKRREPSPTSTNTSDATTIAAARPSLEKVPSETPSVPVPPAAVTAELRIPPTSSASTLAFADGPQMSKVSSDRSGSDKIAVSPHRSPLPEAVSHSTPLSNDVSPKKPSSAGSAVPRVACPPPQLPKPAFQSPLQSPQLPEAVHQTSLQPPPSVPNLDKSLPPSPLAIEDQRYPFRLPTDEEAQAPREETLDPMIAVIRKSLEDHDVQLPGGGRRKGGRQRGRDGDMV